MTKFFNYLKYLFTPQERNNYRAKILHPSFLVFFAFVFLLNQVLINFVALLRPGVLGYSSEITPERIVELTNGERIKSNLSTLETNSLLNEAARRKAGDMFAFDYWAHRSPSGRTPWSFLREVNYDYRVAGENLARDFSDPDSVVEAWMKSPTHRENIMNSKFKEIGVAVVEGTLGGIRTTLVVQFFGTPTKAAAAGASREITAIIPEPVLVGQEGGTPGILSKESRVFSPLNITRGVGGFLFGLIAGALIIDSYLIFKKRVYRSTGVTAAHTGFLAVMFLLLLLSQPGIIR